MIEVIAPNGQRMPATDPKPSERHLQPAIAIRQIGGKNVYRFICWADPAKALPGVVFGKVKP